ncbi:MULTISPECIES: HAD family phosphatase [Kribbella]|uniref:Hydrolase of the HAD superfamily/hydrolase n=1 Tax=Kribbella pratensis TaxID=2512112 RepID=A0ABY2FRS4_9ACTN|nr:MULTISPECIES: HAD family phosphatase [Kribbella]TDW95484.1 putative hydrolase of the HAD superfamily/hydrolase [Kribbella pratensis]TDX08492.1 putative hydrolase of the HAD superfamily/hydrolase [Kribbella sp. VKM Ac-2566]
MVEERAVPRGLLVDWGGVLTSGLEPALRRWAELDDFDFDSYLEAVMKWLPSESVTAELNPVHALERGQIAVPDFERKLASILVRRDGTPVPAEGLIERMFAHFEHQPAMSALVRRANERGIRTALLSNSWGNTYPRDTWDGMFDDIVISGEVGLRKPEPEIFELAAQRLGLEPAECVFVDDLQLNVDGARAVGMTAILHTEYDETRRALETLFGADLT